MKLSGEGRTRSGRVRIPEELKAVALNENGNIYYNYLRGAKKEANYIKHNRKVNSALLDLSVVKKLRKVNFLVSSSDSPETVEQMRDRSFSASIAVLSRSGETEEVHVVDVVSSRLSDGDVEVFFFHDGEIRFFSADELRTRYVDRLSKDVDFNKVTGAFWNIHMRAKAEELKAQFSEAGLAVPNFRKELREAYHASLESPFSPERPYVKFKAVSKVYGIRLLHAYIFQNTEGGLDVYVKDQALTYDGYLLPMMPLNKYVEMLELYNE